MNAKRHCIGLGPTTLWILAAACATAATVPALAQPGQDGARRRGAQGRAGGFATLMQPEFLGRDLVILDEHLDLDESQQWIIETNLLEYETAFQEGVEAVRQQMRGARSETSVKRESAAREMAQLRRELIDLRNQGAATSPTDRIKELSARVEAVQRDLDSYPPESPDPARVEALGSVIAAWTGQRQAIGAAFVESVRSILTKEQGEQWPAAERALRRQKLMTRGRISGESVNLYFLVGALPGGAGAQDAVAEILEQYSIALDAALVAREESLAKAQQDRWSARMAGDEERAAALAAQESPLRVAVRSVNEQYVESIAAALAPEAAADLRDRYRRAAYPRIYRRSGTQLAFDAAVKLPGLDPAVAGSITTLRESFLTELAAQNLALEEVTREQEPRLMNEPRMRRGDRAPGQSPGQSPGQAPGAGERGGAASNPALAARTDLENRYRRQLESLLTPEQVASLPSSRMGRGTGRPGEDMRPEILERFDTNGDGELDDNELQQARQARGRRDGG